MPLLIFPDCHGFYIREEKGGLLIGGSEPDGHHEDRRVDPLSPPKSDSLHSRQAFRVREYIHGIEDVIPFLAHADIEAVKGGLPTFTQDTRFVVDEAPSLQGAYYVSGCNEGGITHGPALGKLVTELILDGSSAWDQFRVARLTETDA